MPKSDNVGSGPIEKISLNIVEATKVLMPVSLGKVKTNVADDNIATQIRADIVELNSRKINLIISRGRDNFNVDSVNKDIAVSVLYIVQEITS